MDGDLKFNPSTVQAALASAARIAVMLVAGFTALLGILARGDLSELYAYIQSTDGLTFLTAIITVVTFGFSIYTKIRERKALTKAEPFAPNLEAK